MRLMQRQHVNLLITVHGMPQVQPGAKLQVARLKNTLQQQNRSAPTQRTNPGGLGQIEQCKAIGAAQALKHIL